MSRKFSFEPGKFYVLSGGILIKILEVDQRVVRYIYFNEIMCRWVPRIDKEQDIFGRSLIVDEGLAQRHLNECATAQEVEEEGILGMLGMPPPDDLYTDEDGEPV